MSNIWRPTSLFALLGTICVLSLPNTGWAGHSLADIAGTAAMEMENRALDQGYRNVSVDVRPLDSRLNLAVCGEPLSVLPSNTERALGPVTVGIRCNSPEPWTLYVRGQVAASMEVPVLLTSLERGSLISTSDLEVQMRDISNDSAGIITEMDQIVGNEAKRNLSASTPLRFSDLKAPELVERGQTVTIVSGAGGLSVSMQGKALGSGAESDRVWVTNLSSGKRVEGVIAPDGSVVIP